MVSSTIMNGSYTIGQLASAVGIPTSTVRYYERKGLLRPTGRTDGNYRYYGKDARERLQFIRAAQASGFTLEDVSAILDLNDGATSPCKEVQDLIEQRLAETEQRLAGLRRVRTEDRAPKREIPFGPPPSSPPDFFSKFTGMSAKLAACTPPTPPGPHRMEDFR